MNAGWKMLFALLGGAAIYEMGVNIGEHRERHEYYNRARAYCNSVGKPLLTVGMQRTRVNPPDGDYVVDIDPDVQNIPGGVLASVTDMPFPNKLFGVAYNSHVLEHLNTVGEIEEAIAECRRVADYTVLLVPSPYSIYANLFCPSHKFRLWFDTQKNRIVAKPSGWQTGLGVDYPAGAVKQVMVTYEPLPMPVIIKGT